jgi:hypothetical protein
MARLQPTSDVLAARAKASIAKYMPQIKAAIVEEAKKQGHDISAKNVKSVTFQKLDKLTYDIFSIAFGDFVITDPNDLIWLDGMTWTNNSPGTATRTLVVDESTEDTYTWQITAGFTYQYQQSQEFNIYAPAGGSIKNTFTFTFNFQASYGQASKKVHAWKNQFEQEIPPNSVVRMEVKGIQFVGYVPFTVTARANGTAQCECVIDYWGQHTRPVPIELSRILSEAERTFVSKGRVDGVQGYDWSVKSLTPVPLTPDQSAQLPAGVTGQSLALASLSLPPLPRSARKR